MDSAIGMRRHERSAPANGSSGVSVEWPTLLGRMLEDVSRVIQLELQLLEARLAPSLTAMADRAIAGLMLLYAGVIGGSCLLAALILLLHDWMLWWQCFALGGIVTIACAFALRIGITRSPVPTEGNKS